MSAPPTLVWLRQDLRLEDHPALIAGIERGGPVVPIYVWAPAEEGTWPPGAASRWWLHHSLRALGEELARRGSRLILRKGASLAVLRQAVSETGAAAVVWHRRYEPAARERDRRVAAGLAADGIVVGEHAGALLHEPETIATRGGTPFQVFTPFWTACQARPDPPFPLPAPRTLPAPARWPGSDPLASLGLEPEVDWAAGLLEAWAPGEAGARRELDRFLGRVAEYPEGRDHPADPGTSRLSPHLHFGEISPRRIWHAVSEISSRRADAARGSGAYRRQLGWREFAHHLLFHFPRTAEEPLRPAFARFPYACPGRSLRDWRKGRTGYPMVDAGMRELWRTGWMHNRVRMIAASFLVKDLLIDWREGARWFWDTLVDADLANNTLGWQWTAGCGADAAPYFRIFNPVSQGEKFDPRGEYVRRWIGELAALPDRWLHRPFEAPAEELRRAGIDPGRTYPRPVVNHAEARARALAAFGTLIPAGRSGKVR